MAIAANIFAYGIIRQLNGLDAQLHFATDLTYEKWALIVALSLETSPYCASFTHNTFSVGV